MADPFHLVRAGNRCPDKVRRRVQKEMPGHRGRKRDPCATNSKLLLSGHKRLNESGHQRMLLPCGWAILRAEEVPGAWLANYTAVRGGSRRRYMIGARGEPTDVALEAGDDRS